MTARCPFFRWFHGGRTNACFNEVDRHVLGGRGARRRSSSRATAGTRRATTARRPGTGQHRQLPRLLLETVLRARAADPGPSRGDRIAFNLPNILEQIFYTEAAKRLGIIYTPVFGGFSAKTLSDRIYDAGARVVVTADGGYRNAEVVSYKEATRTRRWTTSSPCRRPRLPGSRAGAL
jgi:acrylyl-CoA reductase (NADPH)/3-hydroxypropionyl-CoA dehydratase/3-hydroxypropionyl-CoA synthetase